MKAVRILGTFRRGSLRGKWLRYHFQRFLWEHGFAVVASDAITVRAPSVHYPEDLKITQWHQDGNHANYRPRNGHKFLIAMWSSTRPTEIRMKRSRRVIKIEPGEVVIVKNDLTEHRMPEGGMVGRWFIRATDVRELQ